MADMVFERVKKERNYTVIDNTFIKDRRLSWKAKGVFAYILSLPEDWKIHLSELQTRACDGETSLRSAIKELTEYGYIVQQRRKDDNGKFAGYAYLIVENPSSENFPQLENPNVGNPNVGNPNVGNPNVGNPNVGNPNVGNPNVGNHGLLNTYNTNNLNKQNTNKFNPGTPLIQPNTRKAKQSKKVKDDATMKGMIYSFTQNEEIQNKLLEYYSIRRKKDLVPTQWSIILSDLREATNGNIDEAIQLINAAIAGGYKQIVYKSNKLQAPNKQAKFDNTAGRVVKAVATMSEQEKREFEQNLARDENGNLLKF